MVEAKASHREVVYTEYPEGGDGVCGTEYVCHGNETVHVSDGESWLRAIVDSKEVVGPLLLSGQVQQWQRA